MASCTPCRVPFSVQHLDLPTTKKAPLSYSGPSASPAAVSSLSCPNLPPTTPQFKSEPPPHRECPLQSDSSAKFSRDYNLFSFHCLPSPRDADDALFAVNYITGITTPLKQLIFHYQMACLFFSLSPTRLWVHLSRIGHHAAPPHPLYSLRSLAFVIIVRNIMTYYIYIYIHMLS